MLSCLASWALLACSEEPPLLFVDLKTDLVPGVEFDSVEVRVVETDGRARLVETPVDRGGGWVAGRRVGEVTGLSPGTLSLLVELRRGPLTVAERPVIVVFEKNTAVTVPIARTCLNIVCPEAGGEASLTACHGGRCVDPRCTDESAGSCGVPACTAASQCPAPAGACAAARCESRICFSEAAGACAGGEFCDPDLGCTPEPGDPSMDAGADTGRPDAADASGADGGADADAAMPSPEVCNGLDDDRDSRVDEAPPGGLATACVAFGASEMGDGAQTMSSENLRVSLYPVPAAANLVALHAFLAPTGGAALPVRAVLYGDAGCVGGTVCGELVVASEEVTVLPTDPPGWVRFAFAAPLAVAIGDVYVGIQNGAPGDVCTYAFTGTGQRWNWSTPYAASPPGSFMLSSPSTGEIAIIAERAP